MSNHTACHCWETPGYFTDDVLAWVDKHITCPSLIAGDERHGWDITVTHVDGNTVARWAEVNIGEDHFPSTCHGPAEPRTGTAPYRRTDWKTATIDGLTPFTITNGTIHRHGKASA